MAADDLDGGCTRAFAVFAFGRSRSHPFAGCARSSFANTFERLGGCELEEAEDGERELDCGEAATPTPQMDIPPNMYIEVPCWVQAMLLWTGGIHLVSLIFFHDTQEADGAPSTKLISTRSALLSECPEIPGSDSQPWFRAAADGIDFIGVRARLRAPLDQFEKICKK